MHKMLHDRPVTKKSPLRRAGGVQSVDLYVQGIAGIVAYAVDEQVNAVVSGGEAGGGNPTVQRHQRAAFCIGGVVVQVIGVLFTAFAFEYDGESLQIGGAFFNIAAGDADGFEGIIHDVDIVREGLMAVSVH